MYTKRYRLRFHRDLGWQLLVLYLLLVIPFLFALLGFDQLVGDRIQTDVTANDLAIAHAIAQETNRTISNALKAVEGLSKYPGVIESDPAEMERLFSVLLNTRPDINLVYRLDADGFMQYHYPVGPGSTVGINFSHRDYYQRALITNKPLVSEGRISPTTDQAVATAVMPIYSENGKFLGLIGTNITLKSLSTTLSGIISEHENEENLQLAILDSNAQIIAYPDPSFLLHPANELIPEFFERNVSGGNVTYTARDIFSQERLYTYAPIQEIGWGVVISRPVTTAFATQIFLRQIVLIVAVTYILIGLFFWGTLSFRVIAPIERLAPISEAIGLNQPISHEDRAIIDKQANRIDQIGHLTRSILRMETSIADRIKEQATLLETSSAVVSSLDLQIVLDRILQQAGRLLNVSMSAIVALEEENGVFRIRASRGLSKKFAEELTIQPNEPGSATMRALHAKEPIQISDTETDPSYKPRRLRAWTEGYRSLLAVPLNTQHAPPAALLVMHAKPYIFTYNEIQLLSNFANQAAMAIENAVLFERSDMRLEEQTRRIEALIQSLQDGLILSNLNRKVVYANRRISELADLSPDELSGAPVEQVLGRILHKVPKPQQIQNKITDLLEGKNPLWVEFPLATPGRTLYFRLDAFNVNDGQNLSIGRGLIMRDITADQELDRMKSSLVSTVSHELRTPLAAIKGYASTLLAEDVEWDQNSQREFLTIISDESDRLTNLVNNLLDLSRIESGSLNLSQDECDLERLVHRVARQVSPQIENAVEINIENGLPGLLADRQRLEVILRNLIENSIKYAGKEAAVQVSISKQDEKLIFRVSDNGPGIPHEESQRIFESFYRVDDSLTRFTSGTGLGLAICKGFVHAHGGEIWVEPQQKGTCVAFSIPLIPPTLFSKDNQLLGE